MEDNEKVNLNMSDLPGFVVGCIKSEKGVSVHFTAKEIYILIQLLVSRMDVCNVDTTNDKKLLHKIVKTLTGAPFEIVSAYDR